MGRAHMSRAWRVTMRAWALGVAGAAWLALVASPALGAETVAVKEILDLAPANPSLMVVVPSMGRMSRHLSAANAALDLKMVQLDDPLTRFKQALGIGKGVNDEGPLLVIAAPDGEAGAEGVAGTAGRFVALVPVSDYPAFVQSFGSEGKQAVTELKMADGMTGWARKLDGYVVLGSNRAAVDGYRPAGAGAAILAASGPQAAWQIASSDCSIFIDGAAAGTVKPIAKMVTEWARQAVRSSVANARPGTIGGIWAKALQGMGDGLTEAALRDCQGLLISADSDESGVSLSLSMQFKPGTEAAAVFAGQGESAPLLLRLPPDPFLLAGGAHVPSSGMVALSEQAATVAAQSGSPVLRALASKSVPLMKKARYIADLASPPQAGGAVESLYFGATIIETSDTAGTIQTIKDLIAALAAADVPDAASGDPGLGMIANYIPKGLRIDDIDVDTYEVHYTFPQTMMQDMGLSVGPLTLLISGGGRSGYVAAINENYVVVTTTPDTPFFKKVVAAVKQESGLGSSDLIAHVRANQVPKPSAEIFVGFHTVNTAFNHFLKMTGRKELPAMEEAPPITLAWHGANGGVTGRLLVPTLVAKRLHLHGQDMLSPFLPWEMIPGAKPPADAAADAKPAR